MFKISINNKEEREYYVYNTNELNFVVNLTSIMIQVPNYYNIQIIKGTPNLVQYTNTEPVIMPNTAITYDNVLKTFNYSFGINISPEEYNALYEEYLNQMNQNPTEEYLSIKKIQEDVKYILTKKRH